MSRNTIQGSKLVALTTSERVILLDAEGAQGLKVNSEFWFSGLYSTSIIRESTSAATLVYLKLRVNTKVDPHLSA